MRENPYSLKKAETMDVFRQGLRDGLPIGLAKKQAARCCMEALVLYLTFHYFLSTILSQWGNVFGVDFAA